MSLTRFAYPSGNSFKMINARGLNVNFIPNVVVAYSLRRINREYTGSCIEVRRSSDGTTANIGFVGDYLDTGGLLGFCGSSSGFVRTWYTQIGTVNAVETTAANQPRIVLNGSLETVNDRVAIRFIEASATRLVASTSFTTSNVSVYLIARHDSPSNSARLVAIAPSGGDTSGYRIFWQSNAWHAGFLGSTIGSVLPSTSLYSIHGIVGRLTALWGNLFLRTSGQFSSSSVVYTTTTLGNSNPLGSPFNGWISEAIICSDAHDYAWRWWIQQNQMNNHFIFLPN